MDDDLSEFIAYVTRHMVCESCSTPYRPDDVQLVLHEDIRHMLLATCPACQRERMVMAYDQPPYVQLQRVPGRVIPAKITPDVIEGWTTFLESFSGDMYDLLGQL